LNSSLQTLPESPISTAFKKRISTATVAICTRNRPVVLQKCLAAVARLNPAPAYVIVIDNSEGNRDTRKVAVDYGARYIIEPVRGLCRARNRALTECDTDILAFLDDDVTPTSNWLRHLIEPFSDERTGASAGSVIPPDTLLIDHPHQSSRDLSNQDPHWFEIATFGGLGFGENMALRKRACTPGKFFDERLGRDGPFEIGDESYAFASILARGHRVVYTPSAVVHHPLPTRTEVDRDARNSFSYWLLLFSEFPDQRLNLLRVLVRRLRGRKLEWKPNPQDPCEVTSRRLNWKINAAFRGFVLFLRTPKCR
jgi:glycosyltransferase involved in cell wall biosynthesis